MEESEGRLRSGPRDHPFSDGQSRDERKDEGMKMKAMWAEGDQEVKGFIAPKSDMLSGWSIEGGRGGGWKRW